MKKDAKLTFIKGNNFSGRSNFIYTKIRNCIEKNENNYAQLVKELPINNITGIFSTVIEEINLHSSNATIELKESVFEFLNQIGFNQYFDKNPFSLSGGEQAILVLVCNLLLNPKELFVDSTIEQLNETWYKPLFDFICTNDAVVSKLVVADNRYSEYGINEINEFVPNVVKIEYEHKFENPKLLNDDAFNSSKETLAIKNLSFGYSKNDTVFKNINYEFETGSIYHLKGKNGAGKSTLAKILTGVLKVPKDTLLVNGETYNSYKKPGAMCGYSFQNPDEQIFSNSIENEILPFLKNEPLDYTKRRELYIEMFGLQNIIKKHPAEMPFVIRKRIALASTFAMNRQWYIIDEPTLGQDNDFVSFFADLLHLLRNNGKGIILITHCKSLIQKLNYKELNLNPN